MQKPGNRESLSRCYIIMKFSLLLLYNLCCINLNYSSLNWINYTKYSTIHVFHISQSLVLSAFKDNENKQIKNVEEKKQPSWR